jgi:hypothetical protein
MQKIKNHHRKKSGIKTDEPTAINPLDTGTRYQNPGNLQPKDMQQPIINIQNAPAAPDPQGLSGVLGLLGTQGLFKDMTGLEGTQNIALQGMLGNQQAALGYANMASKLAALGNTEKLMNVIKKSGLPADKQAELMQTLLGKASNFLGMGDEGGGSGGNNGNNNYSSRHGAGGSANFYPNGQESQVKIGDLTKTPPPTPPKKWIKSGAGDHVIENPLYAEEREQYEQDLKDWERANGGEKVSEIGENAEDLFGTAPDYPTLYANIIGTAFALYGAGRIPSLTVLDENQKQDLFLNGTWRETTAVLLYEFATNTGLGSRTFFETTAYARTIENCSATHEALSIFVKKYNEQDIPCVNDAYVLNHKFDFSPKLNPFTWLNSLLKHVSTISEENRILIYRGGMQFKMTYEQGDNKIKFEIHDGYSLSSLGAHVLTSRGRNDSNTFGNTDMFVVFDIPKPSNMQP